MDLQVVIHISSTAVCTVVGQFENKGLDTVLKIAAVGMAHTDAFFGGRVDNREHLLSAIYKSVHEASDMASLQILSASLCIASPSMQSRNMCEDIVINNANRMVMPEHIYQANQAMVAKIAQEDRTPFHMIRQLIFLDDYYVQDAKGLMTDQISVSNHVIDMPSHHFEQMIGLVERDELHVEFGIFDGIAGAQYALSEEEKQAGVCFIDIGAGTTKVCVYKDGILIYTHCLEMGGLTVDMDIAKECNIPLLDAESFKRQEGTLDFKKYSLASVVTYKKATKDEKTMLRRELNQIIKARYRNIFDEIIQHMDYSLLSGLDAGLVLAGGGAMMDGLLDFARNHIGIKARMMTVNPNIKLSPERLSDDDIKLLGKHLSDNTLHTALGALLYMNSSQFARDQQIQELPKAKTSWLSERIKAISAYFGRSAAWIKKNG